MAHRPERVDDPADPRIAGYVGLTDAQLRAGWEQAQGLLVVEGHTALGRAARSHYRLRSVLCLPGRLAAVDDALYGLIEPPPVYVAERAVLAATAGFDVHRGVLALAERGLPRSVDEVLTPAAHTVVVLEGLSDQENVGAIARSARGLGVDGLLLDPTSADPLGRRAVRVSMGELLHLPWARATPWPGALAELERAGWRTFALTPADDALDLGDVAREPGDRVAIVVGAEGPGLSEPAMQAATRVRIPMAGGVDSLNVGHAVAVAAWHLRAR